MFLYQNGIFFSCLGCNHSCVCACMHSLNFFSRWKRNIRTFIRILSYVWNVLVSNAIVRSLHSLLLESVYIWFYWTIYLIHVYYRWSSACVRACVFPGNLVNFIRIDMICARVITINPPNNEECRCGRMAILGIFVLFC